MDKCFFTKSKLAQRDREAGRAAVSSRVATSQAPTEHGGEAGPVHDVLSVYNTTQNSKVQCEKKECEIPQ